MVKVEILGPALQDSYYKALNAQVEDNGANAVIGEDFFWDRVAAQMIQHHRELLRDDPPEDYIEGDPLLPVPVDITDAERDDEREIDRLIAEDGDYIAEGDYV